jgi:hypothetical protein
MELWPLNYRSPETHRYVAEVQSLLREPGGVLVEEGMLARRG